MLVPNVYLNSIVSYTAYEDVITVGIPLKRDGFPADQMKLMHFYEPDIVANNRRVAEFLHFSQA